MYIVKLVVDQRHDGPCDVACLDDLSSLLTAPPTASVCVCVNGKQRHRHSPSITLAKRKLPNVTKYE